jgi:hypothetical protein
MVTEVVVSPIFYLFVSPTVFILDPLFQLLPACSLYGKLNNRHEIGNIVELSPLRLISTKLANIHHTIAFSNYPQRHVWVHPLFIMSRRKRLYRRTYQY